MVQNQAVKDLVAMQDDPFQGDLKRLKGTTTAWRRRVGSHRIVYDLYFDEHLDRYLRDFAAHLDDL